MILNVEHVIKELKRIYRDPHGYSNEIIQSRGDDLGLAITKLMNNIKMQQTFPQCLEPCNITSRLVDSQSSEDTQVEYILQKYTLGKYTLDKYTLDNYTF